jgi:predicted kinase
MQLVIFSGLPGTGKSTLAEIVGRKLCIPVFAKDWLEAALVRSGLREPLPCAERLGYAGYELLTTLAERQLQSGQSAVLDSVATFERIRQQWRDLAARYEAKFCGVECICSDERLHRNRLNGRQRHIPGWYELSWANVLAVRERFEPWADSHLIVDAVNPVDENITAVLTYLSQWGDIRRVC